MVVFYDLSRKRLCNCERLFLSRLGKGSVVRSGRPLPPLPVQRVQPLAMPHHNEPLNVAHCLIVRSHGEELRHFDQSGSRILTRAKIMCT